MANQKRAEFHESVGYIKAVDVEAPTMSAAETGFNESVDYIDPVRHNDSLDNFPSSQHLGLNTPKVRF